MQIPSFREKFEYMCCNLCTRRHVHIPVVLEIIPPHDSQISVLFSVNKNFVLETFKTKVSCLLMSLCIDRELVRNDYCEMSICNNKFESPEKKLKFVKKN